MKTAGIKIFPVRVGYSNSVLLNGFDAKIISTPGHTAGSQSVLLGKTLISGDTFINIRNGKIFPPFASEPKILLKTWQQLFDLGIGEIYPGHGPKFKVEKALTEFEKWNKRFPVQELI